MIKVNIALSASLQDGSNVSVSRYYLEAIHASGGFASPLAPCIDDKYINEVAQSFDGFLFCGGEDIDPSYYGEERGEKLRNVCSLRDEFEFKLFKAVFKTGKPIFGICRGMQGINVFLGGSLYQHIDGHIQTEEKPTRTHSVKVGRGTLLYNIVKDDSLPVNTFHHQVVKKLADGLVRDAESDDGYIEAFHLDGHRFLLGVQWHPECYYSLEKSSKRIFDAFIEACR